MSKRILLIDSDESFAQGLHAAISARGLTATTATNSEQGMSLAKSEPPDLIVVCVEAQPTNGYMLCTRLKKDDQLKGVPVILTSANATPDSFEKHKKLKTRAEEYLIKPFEPHAFLEKAAALLGIALPPEQAPAEEEIVTVEEDEPLGLGDLVSGEDEPVHLSETEAAEAQGLSAPVEESVVVDEVVEEVQVAEEPAQGVDDDLKMFDAAFDSLAPPPKEEPEAAAPAAPSESDEQAFAHLRLAPPPAEEPAAAEAPVAQAEEALPAEEEVPLAAAEPEPEQPVLAELPAAPPGVDPEVHAALEARAQQLEADLAARTAELEAARKSGAATADVHKLKAERTRQDKELLRVKEELNEKDKELIELREKESELELQAQTLKDESTKREVAAKTLQQRADALAAAAKKFERELVQAREELKSVAPLKARIAELDALDKAHQELQRKHADVSAQADSHQKRGAQAEAEAERHKNRASELETELSGARALHESEAEQLRDELNTLKGDTDKLEQQLGEAKAEAGRLAGELAAARAETEAARNDATALTGEKEMLAEERDELRRQLEEAQATAVRNEDRAVKAYQRIKADEKVREKTKKALQIALQLLDEVPAGLEGELGDAAASAEKQSA